MTAPTEMEQAPIVKRPRRISAATILILGVFVIPFVLAAALNSYGPLTVDGTLRMAASTVAGQTIAILSAVTATVLAVRRRYSVPAILAIVVIAAVITLWGIAAMSGAGDLLLTRLDLIAEIDEANR